jgi:hypothetical protein
MDPFDMGIAWCATAAAGSSAAAATAHFTAQSQLDNQVSYVTSFIPDRYKAAAFGSVSCRPSVVDRQIEGVPNRETGCWPAATAFNSTAEPAAAAAMQAFSAWTSPALAVSLLLAMLASSEKKESSFSTAGPH